VPELAGFVGGLEEPGVLYDGLERREGAGEVVGEFVGRVLAGEREAENEGEDGGLGFDLLSAGSPPAAAPAEHFSYVLGKARDPLVSPDYTGQTPAQLLASTLSLSVSIAAGSLAPAVSTSPPAQIPPPDAAACEALGTSTFGPDATKNFAATYVRERDGLLRPAGEVSGGPPPPDETIAARARAPQPLLRPLARPTRRSVLTSFASLA
jgi:hypothetical protein